MLKLYTENNKDKTKSLNDFVEAYGIECHFSTIDLTREDGGCAFK